MSNVSLKRETTRAVGGSRRGYVGKVTLDLLDIFDARTEFALFAFEMR